MTRGVSGEAMTDLHDEYERAYLRRVRHPDPLFQILASEAADAVEKLGASPRLMAQQCGVPVDYVLEELERRARERQK